MCAKQSREQTPQQREVAQMLHDAWQQANWPSIRQFVHETRIHLSEFTAGRILIHKDTPSLETVLILGCYLCSRSDVIKMLKLLGDEMIYKYIEPDGITSEERRWLTAFHTLDADKVPMALAIIEAMGKGA